MSCCRHCRDADATARTIGIAADQYEAFLRKIVSQAASEAGIRADDDLGTSCLAALHRALERGPSGEPLSDDEALHVCRLVARKRRALLDAAVLLNPDDEHAWTRDRIRTLNHALAEERQEGRQERRACRTLLSEAEVLLGERWSDAHGVLIDKIHQALAK